MEGIMAKITIVEAVKAGYSTKPTIYRDIKKGNLTATQNRKGSKVIDVKDLVERYGEPGARPAPAAAPKPTVEAKALKVENELLKADLEQARRDMAEANRRAEEERIAARNERERLYSLVETSQKQIEDMTAQSQKGLFKRLFS
jgi:hypothetical protein